MFLIYSFVGGHLGCFHFLVILNDSGSKHGCVRILVMGLYILWVCAHGGLASSCRIISSVFSCLHEDFHSLRVYLYPHTYGALVSVPECPLGVCFSLSSLSP